MDWKCIEIYTGSENVTEDNVWNYLLVSPDMTLVNDQLIFLIKIDVKIPYENTVESMKEFLNFTDDRLIKLNIAIPLATLTYTCLRSVLFIMSNRMPKSFNSSTFYSRWPSKKKKKTPIQGVFRNILAWKLR